jgi:hypothetical protein
MMSFHSFLVVCLLLIDFRRIQSFEVLAPSLLGSVTASVNLRMAFDGSSEISPSRELESGDNPCWQNMLDDDCSMGTIYAANFVASKWIKSMPCGEGIEVHEIFWECIFSHLDAVILTPMYGFIFRIAICLRPYRRRTLVPKQVWTEWT